MAERPIRLAIEGMHCGGCVNRVTAALGKAPGVTVEKVEIGSAEVRAGDDPETVPALIAALARIGFDAREA